MKKILISAAIMAAFTLSATAQSNNFRNERQVVMTSNIPYRTGDSQSWVLDMAEPANFGDQGLRPAIVIIHGGGWAQGYKHHAVYRDLMIDYATKGYVTFSVEYRFTSEADWPACIEDVKCAIRWIKAHSEELRVDPDRIGCFGHSAGAHLSLMLGVSSDNKALEGDGPWQEYSSSVACAAAGAPPTEIGRPIIPLSERTDWWPIGYFNAENVSPLLLMQGYQDPVVKEPLTTDFVEKMRAAGNEVEYIRAEGEHGVAYEQQLAITKPAMDRFFAKYLKPGTCGIVKAKFVDEYGTGLYKSIVASEAALPGYTVYRPMDLGFAAEKEGPLPVIIWANGGCSDTSITHERVLSEIASHGYVIVAIGDMQIEFSDREHKGTGEKRLVEAMDAAIAMFETPGSEYYELVDTKKVAIAGQSCGGAQVLVACGDPRVKTCMMFNSGMGDIEMSGASKKSLKDLHTPIIYIIGGESDVAYANAIKDYERIDKKIPVAFADLTEGGHMGTFGSMFGGSFSRMALDWLDWQMKGIDRSEVFVNGNLDRYPGWTMKARNF